MELNKATLIIEYVDEATGEVSSKEINVIDALATAIVSKPKRSSSSSRSKLIEDETPRVILEDNKYSLTTGALKLLNVTPGSEDKVDIQYQKIGKVEYPLIGTPEAYGNEKGGNKITKSGTVRFGGNKHDQLAEFGNEFILVKHPNSDNLFILTQDGQVPEGNASLDSLKNKKKTSSKKENPEPEVEQPEPEDEDNVDDLTSLLEDEEDKDFDQSDFTL